MKDKKPIPTAPSKRKPFKVIKARNGLKHVKVRVTIELPVNYLDCDEKRLSKDEVREMIIESDFKSLGQNINVDSVSPVK